MKDNPYYTFPLLLLFLMITACSSSGNGGDGTLQNEKLSNLAAALPEEQDAPGLSTAVFASGCFWCTEAVFERVAGVKEAISGYAGGAGKNPSYKEVSEGRSDHAEAVIVYYDSTVVSYDLLLDIFFHSHDPTQLNRQGPDVGKQYRSGIYYNSTYQERLATAYKEQLGKKGDYSQAIVTEIKPLTKFWPAENYHQDYYKLNPDNPYIRSVSKPKVQKFEKEYQQYLKKEYRKNM